MYEQSWIMGLFSLIGIVFTTVIGWMFKIVCIWAIIRITLWLTGG